MKITETAKLHLLETFKKLHKDVLVITLDKKDKSHNPSLNIEVQSEEEQKEYELVNDIKVHIEDSLKELFEEVVMDYINGGFHLQAYSSCENCDCECEPDKCSEKCSCKRR